MLIELSFHSLVQPMKGAGLSDLAHSTTAQLKALCLANLEIASTGPTSFLPLLAFRSLRVLSLEGTRICDDGHGTVLSPSCTTSLVMISLKVSVLNTGQLAF